MVRHGTLTHTWYVTFFRVYITHCFFVQKKMFFRKSRCICNRTSTFWCSNVECGKCDIFIKIKKWADIFHNNKTIVLWLCHRFDLCYRPQWCHRKKWESLAFSCFPALIEWLMDGLECHTEVKRTGYVKEALR